MVDCGRYNSQRRSERVGYSYDGDIFLANGDDEVVLLDTALNEVDRVEYDGGLLFPDPNGASMALTNPGLDNNVGANWCESTTSFGAGDLGTPGAANVCPSTTGIGSPIATICNGACPAWIARLLVDDLAEGTLQILQNGMTTSSTGHDVVHLWY